MDRYMEHYAPDHKKSSQSLERSVWWSEPATSLTLAAPRHRIGTVPRTTHS